MEEVLLTPDKIVGYILLVIVLLLLLIIALAKRKDFWNAILGNDKKLQSAEITILLGLILFPIVVLSDVFLELHASAHVVYSLDVIILGGLTAKGHKEYIKNKSSKDE